MDLSWSFGVVKECNSNVPFWIFDVVKQWINNRITYLCSSLECDNAHRASYFCPDVDNARYCYFHQMGIFWKWYPACGLYITLMSLRNVRAAHSWFLKSWIWKSTWRYGILKLHVLIMQPSMLHNIWKISIEKKRRSEYETNKDIVLPHTRGGGVMNILKSAHERISDASNTIGWCG